MSPTLKALGIDQLSVAQRILLVEEIWDSIAEEEEDLAEAKAWYERKRKGLGEEFVLCVEAALDHIRRFSAAATEVYPGMRRVVMPVGACVA